ncbi:hypothetical protein PHJA_001494700 [Phtheirospermum japonicum]|uniref:Uncharacterized protein n=1 Tax=Phtheirospermum japonicum TaxID=374723 RepID=A0A830CBW1_9LAMI|nr:hypothetical protein PHJA_001494700 [Phtheirospermum japonicum]
MGSNGGGKIPNSYRHHHGGGGHHHHHHFFYISPHCPLHRSVLQPENHSPSCYFSTSYPSHSIPEPVASIQPDPNLSLVGTQPSEELDDAL